MNKIGGIQMLRAVAANMVVLNHIWATEQKHQTSAGGLPAFFERSGPYGVYLFFVISGFVIIRVAAVEDWRQFIFARITRIYPPYWFYTAILLLGYMIVPQLLADRPGVSLLASFALWPTTESPLLTVGWTLVHEMYFYLVVAAISAAGLRPFYGLALWAGVIVTAQFLPYEASPVAAVAFSPLTLLFIAGACLGLLTAGSRAGRSGKPSLMERGIIALGDASYSTYLSHVLIISAIWRVSLILPWQPAQWTLIAFAVVAANAFGLLSYRFIERPMMSAGRQLTAPRYAAIK